MRVFLSYGRLDTAPLVQAVSAALRAETFDPWRDIDRIRFSDDWRAAILQGIDDCDAVIAFLSPHAVRPGGVCLDELALALGRKPILPLLCAPSDQVAVPASIAHVHRLDLTDWPDHIDDPAWLADKVAAIRDVLEDPRNRHFADELDTLRRWLDLHDHVATIAGLIRHFIPREWLVDRVNQWRAGDHRIFHLIGRPGMGKSAFAAWIAHFARANVVGLNLAEFGHERRANVFRVIRTLAFLIAVRLPDYRHRLMALHGRLDLDDPDLTANGLFDALLAHPLHGIGGGRTRDRFVLLLDALDEARRPDGENPLADLLRDKARDLPPWMAIVATSRPEVTLHALGDGIETLTLGQDDAPAHEQDIAACVAAWFPAEHQARIIERCEGNFLYLTLLRDSPLDIPNPPLGLFELYNRFFRRQFPTPENFARVRPFMDVMAVATRPVPLPVLAAIVPGWDDEPTLAAALRALGSLFVREVAGVAPFHSSVRDFLTDVERSGFVASSRDGRRRLSAHLWAALLAGDRGDFLLRELPAQLSAMVQRRDDPGLGALWDAAGGPDTAFVRVRDVAQALRDDRRWQDAADWFRALADIAARDAAPFTRYALVELGDIHRTQGRTDAAMAAYAESRDMAERLARADPGNAEWQRDLSVSFNRIGDVLLDQGKGEEALAAFRDGLGIAERLARADPGNAEWQRDLSVSFNKIGDVLRNQGKGEEALAAFRDSHAIFERLARADPGNAGWQRDVAVSQLNIALIHRQRGDLAAARREFAASRAIIADLIARAPGLAVLRRDLRWLDEQLARLPP